MGLLIKCYCFCVYKLLSLDNVLVMLLWIFGVIW